MRRIAVTGALGHIGSRFIHALKPGEYNEVLLIDNMSTQRYCSLFDLPNGVPYRFIEADICDADLRLLFDNIDAVIHLAAVTNAAGSFDVQDQVEHVNYAGTERVARACAATETRLVFLSTTSVYGTQDETVDESCPTANLQPQSPYATSKLRAEEMLQALGKADGLRFFAGRFGTIFGVSPGMRFHTAVNKFCWQATLGLPLTVWRTALDQKRPYLGLEDAVRGLKFVIEGDHFDNQIYNVLTTNATVADIVDVIRARIEDVQVDLVDAQIMNQLSYCVENAKFRGLGFTFEDDIRRGISDTLTLLQGMQNHSM